MEKLKIKRELPKISTAFGNHPTERKKDQGTTDNSKNVLKKPKIRLEFPKKVVEPKEATTPSNEEIIKPIKIKQANSNTPKNRKRRKKKKKKKKKC